MRVAKFRLSSNDEVSPGFSNFLKAREDHGRALRGERLKQVCACPLFVVENEKNLMWPKRLSRLY